MKVKLTKAGSSVAVIIPSAILKILNICAKNYKKYTLDLKINEDKQEILLSNFVESEPAAPDDIPEDEIPF